MNRARLHVMNPSTGETIRELPMDDREMALGKLDAAWACFQDRSQALALHERIEILERLHALMASEEQALAELIALEGGKPLQDALVEASRATAGVRIAINVISEDLGTVIPLGHRAASAGRSNFTRKFSRGVVLAFSAFNHPLNLIVHQIDLQRAHWVASHFPERAWLAANLSLGADDQARRLRLQSTAQATGLPITACGDVHMHTRKRRMLQDVLSAIRHGCQVRELGYRALPCGEKHLQLRNNLQARYPQAWLEESLRIAERCQFGLDRSAMCCSS